jgi:hypothetical protein
MLGTGLTFARERLVRYGEFMHGETFGCHCGVFSLALSNNGILIPGSKNKPVYKSFFPYMEINELSGHYVMRADSEDVVICEILVHVLIVGHQSEPEPFLGIKPMETDPEELRGMFKPFIGKKVELNFTPFKTQSDSNAKHKQVRNLSKMPAIKAEQYIAHEAPKVKADVETTKDESPDYIVREYIDFVNKQVGVYMDAIAGFAGHYARVERQICRIMRKTKLKKSDQHPVVWASYEDPCQPDIIHNRIIRSDDYLLSNSIDGSNTQQHSQAILVFLFTYWEDEIRPRLAKSMSVEVNEIISDIMGDMRILRNVILHSKGIIRADKYKDLKLLGEMFSVNQPINVSYENMHKIFVLIKQDCARLLFKWLGVENSSNFKPEDLLDVAIQMRRKPH